MTEPESFELRGFLGDRPRIVSASIARVEVHRALRRGGAAAAVLAEATQFFHGIHLRRPSDQLLDRAERLGPHSLRTLDAVHLATALDFWPLPDCFLCYNQRLATAARLQGLTVVAPGVDEVHEP